jgi:radical SAM superfamily enzyme YgiQ (UPF0313 family)
MDKYKIRRPVVLLVVPEYSSVKVNGYVMPYGILAVSASLKAADVADVRTVNLNHRTEDSKSVLKRMIDTCNVDMIGTGGISGQFADVFNVFRLAKEIKPEIITIAGGGLITSDAETAMEALSIVDYGVIGEGEQTVGKLVYALWSGNDINKVQNLICKTSCGYFRTGKSKKDIDLELLPIPDYAGFDYAEYLKMNVEMENGIGYSPVAIIGGRSCKYNCTFCFHPTGSKYRQRSLDSIFKELDYLTGNYEVNYVAFREELFASDKRRIFDFCSRIKKYGLVWSIQLRVDSVDEEIVKMLKESNCRYIFLGIESADNSILKSMRKHITVEQVEKALQLTADAGLGTRSTIILGDAVETMETAWKTFDWWMNYKRRFSISMDMIIAFPGSALYKQACANGRIPDPVRFLKDGCPVINLSTKMSDEEFEQLTSKIAEYNGVKYTVYNYRSKT